MFDRLPSASQNIAAAASLVADGGRALDTDQRRDIAQLPHPLGVLGGQERAVGEELEVARAVLGEDVPEVGVQQGLAAKEAKESRAMVVGGFDEAVDFLRGKVGRRAIYVYPAALASQIAAAGDGQKQKRRKHHALAKATLKPMDRPDVADSASPGNRREQAQVGDAEKSPCSGFKTRAGQRDFELLSKGTHPKRRHLKVEGWQELHPNLL